MDKLIPIFEVSISEIIIQFHSLDSLMSNKVTKNRETMFCHFDGMVSDGKIECHKFILLLFRDV